MMNEFDLLPAACAYFEALDALRGLLEAHDAAGLQSHPLQCGCRGCMVHRALWRRACRKENRAREAGLAAWRRMQASGVAR